MQQSISILLEIFYIIMGLIMLFIAYKSYISINSINKYFTAIFWVLIAVPFIFGKLLSANIVGIMLVLASCLTFSKKVIFAKYDEVDEYKEQSSSEKIKNKIFIPSLVLAFVAVIVAVVLSKYKSSSEFSIGIGSVIAMLSAILITKAKPKEVINDGAKLLHQMGPASILPQLLVALGALFTKAGVGTVIASQISNVIPEGNRLFGVIAYVLGMAVFTIIMGNAFAAFSVITAGIGVPFVLAQGANPVIVGALALTAGYCGTLLTPMAANFNIIPATLLECKNEYSVIKYQVPLAISLLIVHILLMYFLAF